MPNNLSGQIDLVDATEGAVLPANTDVASFTDTNTNDTSFNFTASIDWGDGVTTAGTVVGTKGSFTVLGGHTYADEGFPNADKYKKTAAREAEEGDKVSKDAKAFEKKRDELNESAEAHETRHHRLAVGATLVEIGIAIATVAIITRRNSWWLLSTLLGLGGAALATGAYLGLGVI